jgi:cytoskeletal protein CcmA (bactofilin family)
MAEDTKRTIIETGTEIDGAIKSQRPIVLSGSIKGQITAPSLDVTQEGAVTGTIKVSRFSCKGAVGGEVDAESVELSGRVCDATVIKSKTLDVKLGQGNSNVEVTFGNCELQVGELQDRTKVKPVATTSAASKPAHSNPQPAKQDASKQDSSKDVVDVVSELMK